MTDPVDTIESEQGASVSEKASTGQRGYMASSKSTEWQTPKDLFDALWEEFGGFDLDPCGQREHHYTAWKITSQGGGFYDGSVPGMDGLTQPWYGKVYMNPPYGPTVGRWVAKAASEVACGNAELVVALLKATTDVQWWHEYVEPPRPPWVDRGYTVDRPRFIRGRLKFGGTKGPAPFPSVIVVWRRNPLALRPTPDGQARMEGV